MKITKETTLKEILEQTGAEKVLKKHNVPCLNCPMASQEISKLTIGHVAEIYNLDLKKILEELNAADYAPPSIRR